MLLGMHQAGHVGTHERRAAATRRSALTAAGLAVVGAGVLGASACSPQKSPQPSSPRLPDNALITLGVAAGPPPTPSRVGISSVLKIGRDLYVIDCGLGSLNAFTNAGLQFDDLKAMFITHLHTDHIVDYCAGEAFVVLAKPEGAPDSTRGVATFLVLRTRRDGSRNGVRIRRLKDKLGTRSVASGEIEFVDAEAFLLSGEPSADAGPSDGKGLTRMMELTNRLRLGTAPFALGNARRALVESLCYAGQRRAFGGALIDKPLMRRKLAEMVVDVEAALAMVFDGFGAANHRQPRCLPQRIAVPVTKLKTCRLGITVASDAIEIHGGNGYIETWPVARLLRDAQVNTIWEGPDNILCLDVRRGIEQTRAHETLLARLRDAVSVSDDDDTTRLVSRRIEDLDAAITAWTKLDRQLAEARLFPLAQFMGDVYAGALLTEQAAWERATRGTDRKALVARLYARRYLADQGPLRGIDADCDEALQRFDELVAGAFTAEQT
ncbi:Putative acyl-CoA dehydrogenase FadE35 [Mycobacterium tuberculosis]|nr:Putative acyl-CoA dehydrogenase FadE35 [Mycobacterium tuberculosis]